jgi:hypothetical protein
MVEEDRNISFNLQPSTFNFQPAKEVVARILFLRPDQASNSVK